MKDDKRTQDAYRGIQQQENDSTVLQVNISELTNTVS